MSRSESETCNVSALSGWRNTFFSVRNIHFESNASIKQEKCISQRDSKDTIITRTTTFTFLVCKQSLLNLSSCGIYDYVILLIWKLAWDMPVNDSKGNEYHAMNNTIDKQLSSLKVKIYFFAMSKGQAKLSR